MTPLRIGTRASRLALAQAREVAGRLRAIEPACEAEIVEIRTSGDRVTDRPISRIGVKGVFVKEIDEALVAGRIDCAVHSLKDLPSERPAGVVLAAVTERADARDAAVSRDGRTLAEIASAGGVVGTSSLRRAAQAARLWPGLRVENLRGNLDTRLRRLEEGRFDAVLVAGAGLKRLGLGGRATEWLDPEVFVPAPGQGMLAIECLGAANGLRERLARTLDHAPSRAAAGVERAFLTRVEGGCQVPLGCHATIAGARLRAVAIVASPDGSRIVRGECVGDAEDPAAAGLRLAEDVLSRGGAAILAALERERP